MLLVVQFPYYREFYKFIKCFVEKRLSIEFFGKVFEEPPPHIFMKGRFSFIVGFVLVLTLMSFVSAGLFDFFTGKVTENVIQCDETLKDSIYVCDKGEFVGVSVEVIERSDNFVQFKVQEQLKEAVSDRLVEGDIWEVEQVSGGKTLIEVLNIGVDGDLNKVRFKITDIEEEIVKEEKNNVKIGKNDYDQLECPSGCLYEFKCYPFGYRMNGKFCGADNGFSLQYSNDVFCENDHECLSNLCIDSTCVDGSIWQKFVAWLKRFF
jgi:hypothetical protein